MKITVKHFETEIEVSDTQQDDGRALIYNNQTYTFQLIEKIVQQIKLLHLEKGGDK
jgi:hypothetical protein